MQIHPKIKSLCTETIECAAGALERVNNIEGRNGFALCVFGVSYRVTDDLKADDKHTCPGVHV